MSNLVKEITGILLGKEGQGTLKAHMVRGTVGIVGLRAWASPCPAFGLRSEAIWDCRPGRFAMYYFWPKPVERRGVLKRSRGQPSPALGNGWRAKEGAVTIENGPAERHGGVPQRPVQGLVARLEGQLRGGSRNTKNEDLIAGNLALHGLTPTY